MTDDPSNPKHEIFTGRETFSRPPSPEEIDGSLISDPWIFRNRLTFEAYATRSRLLGRAPDISEWFNHLKLNADELSCLNDLIEAQRVKHRDQLGHRFILREYGNKARVGWFDDRGELGTMSFAEFRNAHIEKRIEIQAGDKKKLVPLVEHWLHHPLTTRFDRVDYSLGKSQENMPEVLNLGRAGPSGCNPVGPTTDLVLMGLYK